VGRFDWACGSQACAAQSQAKYIALHKNVKLYFALQNQAVAAAIYGFASGRN
jgi:hypothetical protein